MSAVRFVRRMSMVELLAEFVAGTKYWADVEKGEVHTEKYHKEHSHEKWYETAHPAKDRARRVWYYDSHFSPVYVLRPTAEQRARWSALCNEINRRFPRADK